MNSNKPLESCPYCGSGDDWIAIKKSELEYRMIPYCGECLNCGARGPQARTYAEAEKRWNRRAEQAEKKKVEDVIEHVYNKLCAMPIEDFKKELEEHKDGYYAKVLMETGFFEVNKM